MLNYEFMNFYPGTFYIRTACIVLSVVAHLLLLFPVWKLGSYNFVKPVASLQAVMVDLTQQTNVAETATVAVEQKTIAATRVAKVQSFSPASGATIESMPKIVAQSMAENFSVGTSSVSASNPAEEIFPKNEPLPDVTQPEASMEKLAVIVSQPPLRPSSEFLSTVREKLTYQISLLGMPIGTAVLDAKNQGGEILITLKVKSAPAISSIYPVDDVIETRHIAGNFIITKIKQKEGSFRSDRGFTIFLRDKSVFWIDLLRNRSIREDVPNNQVVDLLSGFYYLRNRPLEVGKTEILHIYDSDTYSSVPVEILRREQIRLPGFRQAETIVIKPNLKTDGIFKRSGDVTIWLTDDDKKVPVRLETTIPLGRITAELVSAEAETPNPPPANSILLSPKAEPQQ